MKRSFVRISNACNAKCIFCLESECFDGTLSSPDEVRLKLEKEFVPREENWLLITGGEPTINSKFAEYIRYAQQRGYNKIHTITNGIMLARLAFVDDCIKAGLNEISFSMHGHRENIHDSLVGVPGAFKKALRGLKYVIKKYPEVNVGINICVNKVNYKYLADIIKFYAEIGVDEFDCILIIPLGKAFQNKKYLFFDLEEAYPYLQRAWRLKEALGIELCTNRFPVEALEGHESLLYDVGNVIDEEIRLFAGDPFSCSGPACRYCFLNQFCDIRVKYLGKRFNKSKLRLVDMNNQDLSKLDLKKKYQLRGYRSLVKLKKDWGNTIEKVKGRFRIINKRKIKTYNLPKCLSEKNIGYTDLLDYSCGGPSLESIISIYIDDLYRRKSLRCKKCKYYMTCEGIHISFIQAYGLRLLEPVIQS